MEGSGLLECTRIGFSTCDEAEFDEEEEEEEEEVADGLEGTGSERRDKPPLLPEPVKNGHPESLLAKAKRCC